MRKILISFTYYTSPRAPATSNPTFGHTKQELSHLEGSPAKSPVFLWMTRIDIFSRSSLLYAHPITSVTRMRLAFTDYLHRSSGMKLQHHRHIPTGPFATRLIQMPEAVTLRRPSAFISDHLLPLPENPICFHRPEIDSNKSNDAGESFSRFSILLLMVGERVERRARSH